MSPPEGAASLSSCYSYEADTLTSLLTTTAANLQIRTEVSSVLTTLLNDVETSSTLSTHLVHKSHTAQLQSQLATAQTALEESRALAQHESIRRQQLGDAFLAELAKLSVKLVELEGWRSDHEGRVAEYDQLKRRLEEMTDRAQALELAVQEGQAEQAANANSSGSAVTEEGAAAATTSAGSEDIIGGGAQKKTGDANAVVEEEKADVDVDVDAQANENVDSTAPPTATDTASAAAATSTLTTEGAEDADAVSDDIAAETDNAKAHSDTGTTIGDLPADTSDIGTDAAINKPGAITNEEEGMQAGTTTPKKKKKKVLTPPNPMDDTEPILECVPERVLMTIFASLDAQDILSTAQVSVVMYSRVDVLFGLGGSGGGGGAENGDGGGASGGADATGITVEELPAAAKTTTAATAESTSEPASAAPTAASALGSTLAGGLFSPFSRTTASKPAAATPTPSAKDATSTAVNTTTTDVKTDAVEDTASATESATPSVTGLATTTVPTGVAGRGRGPMLTPELANSMAEKLGRDELAVIISMQKAQKASESDLTKLRNERDDLIAELKGVESVKDFLVAKLRDVERAQRMAESEKEKVARQVVSDQEVIAFLDYRVQELEGGAEIADRAKSRAEQDLQAAQAKATEKTRVLSDMLRFERDQLAASEKEWKATKKVLVKEVKQCRAQIVSLEAERDGLREQNARLREALLSGGKK